MEALMTIPGTMTAEQNEQITETVQKERRRLFSFIKNRVPETEDAEDILQDVFYELAEMYRLMRPIEKISAWLITTARNKITDLFRKKKTIPFSSKTLAADIREEENEMQEFYAWLPDPADGPEMLLMREVVRDEINKALEEIPEKQREVFIQTEIEGKSFKEISSLTGIPVNTLISRKHYAVLFLRERLQKIYDELLTN